MFICTLAQSKNQSVQDWQLKFEVLELVQDSALSAPTDYQGFQLSTKKTQKKTHFLQISLEWAF